MGRKLVLCALVLGLAGGTATAARAQVGNKAMQSARTAPIPTSARPGAEEQNEVPPASEPSRGIQSQGISEAVGHEDGPAPVDTEESISAGAGAGDSGEADARLPKAEKVAPTAESRAAGTYAGVEPGSARAPAVPVPPGKSPLTITWPGFQMRPDGTSRVFVQSTAALEPQIAQADGKFSLKFLGAQVAGATNRLPLETRFFNTPVTKVSILVGRDGVALVLDLRAPVQPRVSSERGPSGYYFTYLDLPAGKYVENAAPVPVHSEAAAGEVSLVPPQPEHLTTLDGNADQQPKVTGKATLKADTSMDNELPPGIKASGKTKSSGTSASGGIKLGK